MSISYTSMEEAWEAPVVNRKAELWLRYCEASAEVQRLSAEAHLRQLDRVAARARETGHFPSYGYPGQTS